MAPGSPPALGGGPELTNGPSEGWWGPRNAAPCGSVPPPSESPHVSTPSLPSNVPACSNVTGYNPGVLTGPVLTLRVSLHAPTSHFLRSPPCSLPFRSDSMSLFRVSLSLRSCKGEKPRGSSLVKVRREDSKQSCHPEDKTEPTGRGEPEPATSFSRTRG